MPPPLQIEHLTKGSSLIQNHVPHFRLVIRNSEIEAVEKCLRGLHLSDGVEVRALENELSRICGGREVVVVSSGTAALYLSLVVLGIGPGDEVIIPSFACNSLYAAVAHTGASPVCADSDELGPNISAETVTKALTRCTQTVIVPHLFGYLADMDALSDLDMPVIEDCAHVLGGKYDDGSMIGTRGNISVFSFFATKLLQAGEGGACVTDDASLAKRMRLLRNCDEQLPDRHAFNFKMSDICAALARAKLVNLQQDLEERRKASDLLDTALLEWSYQRTTEHSQAVCFRYLVSIPNRATAIVERTLARGIICRRPVFRPLHLSLGGSCPAAERLYRSVISIPCFPGQSQQELRYVQEVLPQVLADLCSSPT